MRRFPILAGGFAFWLAAFLLGYFWPSGTFVGNLITVVMFCAVGLLTLSALLAMLGETGRIIAGVNNPGSRGGGPPRWGRVGIMFIFMLFIASVGGVWFFSATYFGIAIVHVDNFSDRSVVLELDGRRWLERPAQSTVDVHLSRGRYRLVVKDQNSGAELDRLDIDVEGAFLSTPPHYICNTLGAETYYRGAGSYGVPIFGEAAPPIRERWFKADVDYVFESPPSTGYVGSGFSTLSSETRSRSQAPKD